MKKQNGITLVALVITVIILLILAGVALSIVFNGGIIDKSANAVDKYENASANEKNQMEFTQNMFDKFYHNATVRNGNSGETSGGGSGGGSGSGPTTAEWVIDTDYGDTGLSLGDLVKPKSLTGTNAYLANEKFYVIGIDGTGDTQTVRLLAEKCVKTNDATATNNIQNASANTLAFNSSTSKGSEYATSDIKELVDTYVGKLTVAGLTLEDVETVEGGTAVTGTKGRLMWGNQSGGEVQEVLSISVTGRNGNTIVYRPNSDGIYYWLGSHSAINSESVSAVLGPNSSISGYEVTANYFRSSPSNQSFII